MICELPDDAWERVYHHVAALTLQRWWRRTSHYGHARRRHWPAVRAHLHACGAWRALVLYEQVRREWRTEALSWLVTDDFDTIVAEARAGLWGPRARWLDVA